MTPNVLVPNLNGNVVWEFNAILRYQVAQYEQRGLWTDAQRPRKKWMDGSLTTHTTSF